MTTNQIVLHRERPARPRRLSTSPATVAHMHPMTRAESDSCLFMNPVDAATTNSPTPNAAGTNMTPMGMGGASGSADDILAPLETREEELLRSFEAFKFRGCGDSASPRKLPILRVLGLFKHDFLDFDCYERNII